MLGFHSLIEPSDHLVMPKKIRTTYPYSSSGEYTDTREDLDQLTALAFVAAKTGSIRLMTGIAVIPYRSPLSWANTFATLDYLSDGRLDIGAGVGWMKEEFDILRVPFVKRGELMDEYIRIVKSIWAGENPSFEGRYFSFSDAHFSPKVVQKPHPPIWIGGESPRAIRRAAELGDGWFPIDSNPTFPLNTADQLAGGIARLKESIRRAGRKSDNVKIGYLSQTFELSDSHVDRKELLAGDSRKIATDIKKMEEMGVSFIGLGFLRDSVESTKRYAEEFVREVLSRL
jgi:probable F420-dependent oxidoreductase